MRGSCRHKSCFPDTTCALGHLDRTRCEHWLPENHETPEPQPELDNSDFPWNSYALGMRDLAILGGRACPIVVGLIGAPNSGKTSLLMYLYMWLFKHGELPSWVFCGSWTLGAWESIVRYCRWIGEPPPSFPPHTSSTRKNPRDCSTFVSGINWILFEMFCSLMHLANGSPNGPRIRTMTVRKVHVG